VKKKKKNKARRDQTSVRKNERQGYGSRQGMKGTAGKLIKRGEVEGGGGGGKGTRDEVSDQQKREES
jgi:hypothetical protein